MRLWSTAAGLCLVFLACSARGLRWDVDLKTEMTGNLFPQAAKLRSSASGEFLLRSTPMDGVGVGAVWLVTPRESAGLDPLFVAVANTSEPFQLIDLNHDAIDDFVYTSNAQASHVRGRSLSPRPTTVFSRNTPGSSYSSSLSRASKA